MAQKKQSLTAALASAPAPANGAKDQEEAKVPEASKRVTQAKGREKKVNIAAWFAPAVKYGLQELALEQSRARGRKVTLQDLMAEAYNDLFKKYGKAELAPTREE